MIDIWDGPPREGVRGGQEQFKWNQIKEQCYRDRECYLGYSTKVGTTGKFGRFYMNDWWQRKRDNAIKISQEQQDVKEFEEELMQEALGLKPKKLLLMKSKISEEQKAELLRKPEICENDQNEDEKQGISSKGLGYIPHRKHEFIAPIEKLAGTGIDLTKSEDDQMTLGITKKEEPEETKITVKLEPQSDDSSSDESGQIERHGRKERKREKKEKKKLKKARKLEKKAKKEKKKLEKERLAQLGMKKNDDNRKEDKKQEEGREDRIRDDGKRRDDWKDDWRHNNRRGDERQDDRRRDDKYKRFRSRSTDRRRSYS